MSDETFENRSRGGTDRPEDAATPPTGGSGVPAGLEVLELKVGGYMGSSYEVALTGASVLWRSSPGSYANWTEQTVPIDDSAWATFRSTLEGLDVWLWEDSYYDPSVMDGTSWGVRLEWDGESIVSGGSNAFPDTWDDFCIAVELLLGGRKFR